MKSVCSLRSAVIVASLCVPLAFAHAQSARLRLVDVQGREHAISAGEFKALPRVEVSAKAHNDSGSYAGVKLADLIARLGVPLGDSLRGRALAAYVLVEAADGYRVLFALPELSSAYTERVVILADSKNGQPLDEREGPYRVVVPGEKRPARWIRQVTRIRAVMVPPVAGQ